MSRWSIVGGGVLGCSLALKLADAGHQVTLYEAAPELGGLASAWQLADGDGGTISWDRHYHVTLASDARTRKMLADIDLDVLTAMLERTTAALRQSAKATPRAKTTSPTVKRAAKKTAKKK